MSAFASSLDLKPSPVPSEYFDGKDARSFRFIILEDIVKVGHKPPTPYSEVKESDILKLYDDAQRVALYVHAPWCVERCSYCYYWGQAENKHKMRHLVEAEQKHARMMDEKIGLSDRAVPSIYFGGGTPTVLPTELLDECLSFYVGRYSSSNCEVSCEASVASLKSEKIDVLSKYVNRLSIGVQSFNDRLLRRVERIFTGQQAAEILKEVVPRFHSVNIDLIYGLQTQSMAEWMASVEQAAKLNVQSITLYRLEVRENQPLIKSFLEFPDEFPGDEMCRQMRKEAKVLLESAGYRENLVGWFLRPEVDDTTVYRERWKKQTPCIAFGPGVHNYGRDHFYYSTLSKGQYVREIDDEQLPIDSIYRMQPEQQMLWYVLANWKSNEPVSLSVVEERFGPDNAKRFCQEANQYLSWGFLVVNDDDIELTEEGKGAVEWILQDLISSISLPSS